MLLSYRNQSIDLLWKSNDAYVRGALVAESSNELNGVIIVSLSLTLPKLIHLIVFLICFCRFVRKRNLRLFAIKMSLILSNFFDNTFLQMKRILFKVTKLTLHFTWKITMIWTEYETDTKLIKQLTTSAIRATISE